ncbi:hypothetical protein [Actinocrispum wychmicini]|uniref:Uncharacterized protein n=1 Tax=Actinocrispum wychmicini TaxID=1213861 RepID=A0A4R2JHY4_9PSEU|nr:hypothetical protein [Actinocrispum wychmicini]TCO56578.1 hypothetical protein EV192_10651 [Actinocrispum wychmicini]
MLVRLRPVVHASPTPTGLHVRGWASSFTLTGGKGLWTVWQRIAVSLADGVPPADLVAPAGAPPAVAKALAMIVEQLRAHDMLVTVDPDWAGPADEIRTWLESVAPNPAETWTRLQASEITITGPSPLADYALRAITSTGLAASVVAGEDLVLTAGDFAVAAGASDTVGFVVHPGTYEDAVTDAKAVARRLDIRPAEPPDVLAALVGSAAAHRLLCAVGGLPDPSAEFIVHSEDELPPVVPHLGVLVARIDPFRATYHPWLSPARTSLPLEPLRALDVLADAELGPVPEPSMDLPQVPANLAVCGTSLGIGTTADAARLDAVVRELGEAIDLTQSHGDTLRTAVRRRRLDGTILSEVDWADDPTARRWWKALTLRFGVPATIEVTRLAEHAVYAEIRAGERVLSWAIEATPADAVAFAALAATGAEQARQAGVDVPDEPFHLNGAAPSMTHSDTSWVTRDWHWPADVRDREPALQAELMRLVER